MDKPILEGYTVGISAILLALIYALTNEVNPIIIFTVYLIGLTFISISILWQLAKEGNISDWLFIDPTRFFILGFIEIFLIVLFFDFYYLESLGDVLVEAHGLVFDLMLFGIILTIYETLRSRRSNIERYKEELDDYRGWKEKESAYRVGGIIRRLEKEQAINIDFSNLHLGECSKDLIEKVIKEEIEIASLWGANLREADLQKVNLKGIILQEADLIGANLQEADLDKAILQEAILWGANLIETKLRGANLKKVNLWRANLYKAEVWSTDLQEANIQEANLKEANFWKSNLRKSRLLNSDLQRINLMEANLEEANLFGANLVKSRLCNANLYKANLCNTNLQEANLQEANLEGANLQGANLLNTNLQGATLVKANLRESDLTLSNLQGAIVDDLHWLKTLETIKLLGKEYVMKNYEVVLLGGFFVLTKRQ